MMRPDLDIIHDWIVPQSKVLDLGCGDGTLLKDLMTTKAVTGYGLEIDHDNITLCIGNGVNVIEQDLNQGLANVSSRSFDMVVMTQALQAVSQPHALLNEMLRVGKECIITFPNFGHWHCRGYLLTKGRMPMAKHLPYMWYNTPNIHLCTFKDFEQLCGENNIVIKRRMVVDHRHKSRWVMNLWPNMLGKIAIYHITREASNEKSI